MAKGDHLYFSYLFEGNPITHHGIDCGDGYVVEYQTYYQGGKVCCVAKENFGKGRTIHIKEYQQCDSPEQVLERAMSSVGKNGYCLFTNNCEHFAHWCKTGEHKSAQVDQAVEIATNVGVKVLRDLATDFVIKVGAETAVKAVSPLTKFLLKIGIKEAPVVGRATSGVASAGGLVTGLMTDAIVGKILEDDQNLPEQERSARGAGRIAGQVGSTLGAIGGSMALATIGGSIAVSAALAAPIVVGSAAAAAIYHLNKLS